METVSFISDDIEEIKKEQKKQQAIHSLLPSFMGSKNDETKYILLNDEKKKEAFDTVVRSRVFIRNKIKDAVQIRLMPEFHFVIDNSCDYGMHIDKILSTMVIPPAEENDEE